MLIITIFFKKEKKLNIAFKICYIIYIPYSIKKIIINNNKIIEYI